MMSALGTTTYTIFSMMYLHMFSDSSRRVANCPIRLIYDVVRWVWHMFSDSSCRELYVCKSLMAFLYSFTKIQRHE